MRKTIASVAVCIGALASLTPLFARDVSKATSPRSRERENKWWGPRHEQKLDEIKAKGDVDVVFLGDSITHYWEGEKHAASWRKWTADAGLKALNLGFSGDKTENVVWRLQHGELDGFKTSVVVLMIGTNNAGHLKESEEPATNVAAGVRTILDLIREKQPQAKVILCAILPRGRKEDFANNVPWRNLEANVLIRRFCDGKDVVWCDFGNEFLARRGKPDQKLFEDQLHPTDAGYDVFGAAVLPVIMRLLARDARVGHVARVKYADEFIDRMWLWGHLSGQVDGRANPYRLDAAKVDYPMSAALKELGLRNLNVIRWDRPSIGVLKEFKDVKRLTLPGSAHDAEGVRDYSMLHDHVFDIASRMGNVVGIELDDYYRSQMTNEIVTVTTAGPRPTCPASFGLERLAALRKRADLFCRPLDLRLVVYDDLFKERKNPLDLVPAIDQATAVTYWTWKAENLRDLEKNFRFYRTLAPVKPTFLGVYFYDFGGEREMSADEMRFQLDFALRKFRQGEIEGVVFLCSSIVNRDFEAIRIAKKWIRENGSEKWRSMQSADERRSDGQ